ncbi:AMP-binding protein [Planococcus sp. YIM B11945]|uniref:AMP-binding protein n=1 Tax=Planococcus sp. YIM B11945 TaxID=3435410 RepID=UPI003D7E4FBB
MVQLLKVLHKLGFLSPHGINAFLSAMKRDGINLMLLLTMNNQKKGHQIALIDGNKTWTYNELRLQSEKLVTLLTLRCEIEEGQKIAFLCKNHSGLVQALFAFSRLGTQLFLLNPSMSRLQFDQLAEEHDFGCVVFDEEFRFLVEASPKQLKKLTLSQVIEQAETVEIGRLEPSSKSKIVLLTGGTTGKPKQAVHEPSIFNFLAPFSALLERLQLLNSHTAYIATPIYHGYGIAILLAFMALGKKVVIHDKFDEKKACELVFEHKVDVITVVPLMIHKMLETDSEALGTLTCIASGGAKLSERLVENVQNRLGDVLYNLYGTSETGLNLIATPTDLAVNANTVGKPVIGGRFAVMQEGAEVNIGKIGHFCIQNKWSMKNEKNGLIDTGDLGYRDKQGRYFLSGRADDLVISAGMNIYPNDIETVLAAHAAIEDATVIGVDCKHYGQTVKAFVQLRPDKSISQFELREWLSTKLAKYQMPKDIVFMEHLPYTALGKLDKKQLK